MKTSKAILVKLHSSDGDTGSEDERRRDLDGAAVEEISDPGSRITSSLKVTST